MKLIPWKNKRNDIVERGTSAAPFAQLRTEMDRLFDRFFDDLDLAPFGNMTVGGAWMPELDLVEDDKQITLRAELPGVDPKDVEIQVSGDMLTLSGEKQERQEKKSGAYVHTERRYGSFRRSIRLPATVDAERIAAEHVNGVLTVTMPKTAAAQARRIPVKCNGK